MNLLTVKLLDIADMLFPRGRDEFLDDVMPVLKDRHFYTTEELAERYRVTPNTIKNWRAQGKLVPSLKIPGGSVRYSPADLHNFECETGRKEAEQA